MIKPKHQKQCPICGTVFYSVAPIKVMCSPECRVIHASRQHTNPDSCWEWDGSINPSTGYGQLSEWKDGKRKLYTAHRISFRALVGPIPDGLSVLHHCDNRRCFNPNHLYAGTQQQNVDDMHSRGRAKHVIPSVPWQWLHPDKVPRGKNHHLVRNGSGCLVRGESHHSSKVTATDVVAIRASNETLKVLSEKYGMSQSSLSAIRLGKTWKHVV